jgi:hypothetical protein
MHGMERLTLMRASISPIKADETEEEMLKRKKVKRLYLK